MNEKIEEKNMGRLDEGYRFDVETDSFMTMVKYKDVIYIIDKAESDRATYRSVRGMMTLEDHQPYSIEVDKDGNVLDEY